MVGSELSNSGIYVGRSRFYNITQNNVNAHFLVSRDSSRGSQNANMVDTDGTLTGTCGSQIIGPGNWIRFDDSCIYHENMNAYICPPDYQSLRLLYFYDMNYEVVIKAADGNSYNRSLGQVHALYGDRIVGKVRGGPSGQASSELPDLNVYDWTREYFALLPQNADYFLEFPIGTPARLGLQVKKKERGEIDWIQVELSTSWRMATFGYAVSYWIYICDYYGWNDFKSCFESRDY